MASAGWQDLDLEAVADVMLRKDRKRTCKHSFAQIDLLTERDAHRRDRRRHALIMRNLAVLDMFLGPVSSPEDQLIRKQEQRHASAVLSRVIARFERDKTAKAIIFVVLLGDVSFSKTKEIAKACKIREDIVRAAKERLKYHVRLCEKQLDAA